MAQRVMPLPPMLASPMNTTQDLLALLLIQLPVHTPGKTAEDSSSICVLATHMGDPDGVLRPSVSLSLSSSLCHSAFPINKINI